MLYAFLVARSLPYGVPSTQLTRFILNYCVGEGQSEVDYYSKLFQRELTLHGTIANCSH